MRLERVHGIFRLSSDGCPYLCLHLLIVFRDLAQLIDNTLTHDRHEQHLILPQRLVLGIGKETESGLNLSCTLSPRGFVFETVEE